MTEDSPTTPAGETRGPPAGPRRKIRIPRLRDRFAVWRRDALIYIGFSLLAYAPLLVYFAAEFALVGAMSEAGVTRRAMVGAFLWTIGTFGAVGWVTTAVKVRLAGTSWRTARVVKHASRSALHAGVALLIVIGYYFLVPLRRSAMFEVVWQTRHAITACLLGGMYLVAVVPRKVLAARAAPSWTIGWLAALAIWTSLGMLPLDWVWGRVHVSVVAVILSFHVLLVSPVLLVIDAVAYLKRSVPVHEIADVFD